ncbi:MAG: hypothetical protein HOJ35_05630 [Bdellovibrionales bacterium]|jgi:hypothetical protein|nr:hypothetical protein [Bdellovibrionales bacterium]
MRSIMMNAYGLTRNFELDAITEQSNFYATRAYIIVTKFTIREHEKYRFFMPSQRLNN